MKIKRENGPTEKSTKGAELLRKDPRVLLVEYNWDTGLWDYQWAYQDKITIDVLKTEKLEKYYDDCNR